MAGQFSSEVEKLVGQLLQDAAEGQRTTADYLRGLVEQASNSEQLALGKAVRSRIRPSSDSLGYS